MRLTDRRKSIDDLRNGRGGRSTTIFERSAGRVAFRLAEWRPANTPTGEPTGSEPGIACETCALSSLPTEAATQCGRDNVPTNSQSSWCRLGAGAGARWHRISQNHLLAPVASKDVHFG
jgi:hypothetical protein